MQAFLTLMVFGGTLALMFVPKLLSPPTADDTTSMSVNHSTRTDLSSRDRSHHSSDGTQELRGYVFESILQYFSAVNNVEVGFKICRVGRTVESTG